MNNYASIVIVDLIIQQQLLICGYIIAIKVTVNSYATGPAQQFGKTIFIEFKKSRGGFFLHL